MTAQVLLFPTMTRQLDIYPNRIRELRRLHKMSQTALGDAIGTSGVHVGYLEKGERELNLSTMRAIARVFGVATIDILEADDNPLANTPRSRRLLNYWQDSDEPARQAIERVAETMAGYKGPPSGDGLAQLAAPGNHSEPAPAPPKSAKR